MTIGFWQWVWGVLALLFGKPARLHRLALTYADLPGDRLRTTGEQLIEELRRMVEYLKGGHIEHFDTIDNLVRMTARFEDVAKVQRGCIIIGVLNAQGMKEEGVDEDDILSDPVIVDCALMFQRAVAVLYEITDHARDIERILEGYLTRLYNRAELVLRQLEQLHHLNIGTQGKLDERISREEQHRMRDVCKELQADVRQMRVRLTQLKLRRINAAMIDTSSPSFKTDAVAYTNLVKKEQKRALDSDFCRLIGVGFLAESAILSGASMPIVDTGRREKKRNFATLQFELQEIRAHLSQAEREQEKKRKTPDPEDPDAQRVVSLEKYIRESPPSGREDDKEHTSTG